MVFRNILPVIIALGLSIIASCKKRCEINNTPLVPYSITPDKDTFKVGDTMWLTGSFPHKLKELFNNNYYDYSKVDLRSGFYFYNFRDTSEFIFRERQPQYVPNKFKLLLKEGELIDFGYASGITYLHRNDSFIFKTGFIPLDTGIYCVALFYNGLSNVHGTATINVGDKKCTHYLKTLCQSFNGGKSTFYRITDKGYKYWDSPNGINKDFEKWVYNNSFYYFTVVR